MVCALDTAAGNISPFGIADPRPRGDTKTAPSPRMDRYGSVANQLETLTDETHQLHKYWRRQVRSVDASDAIEASWPPDFRPLLDTRLVMLQRPAESNLNDRSLMPSSRRDVFERDWRELRNVAGEAEVHAAKADDVSLAPVTSTVCKVLTRYGLCTLEPDSFEDGTDNDLLDDDLLSLMAADWF